MKTDFDSSLEIARGLIAGNEEPSDLWEANEHLNDALAERPNDSEAWILKCQVMSALSDDASALACCEMALRRSPKHAEAHFWRASVLADLERYEDSLKSAEKSFRFLTDSDEWLLEDLFYLKASVLNAIGRAEDARATFEAGLNELPDSEVLREGLAPIRRDQFQVLSGGKS